jgi:hypothetical protein
MGMRLSPFLSAGKSPCADDGMSRNRRRIIMNQVKKMYAGVNGYDPYKINVTVVNNTAWVKYVVLVLAVVAIRFLCCA